MKANMSRVIEILDRLGISSYDIHNLNFISCSDLRLEIRTYNSYEIWYFPQEYTETFGVCLCCVTDDVKLFEDNIAFIKSRI